ncbi:MAG: rod shape-determining protein RodA [Dethiobacter sp.]|nr:rod shape-determining protein RodA [Dethiobacter sp.]MBS3899559.1 rod shape-determining protein RodA [Dethiobacter sp.]
MFDRRLVRSFDFPLLLSVFAIVLLSLLIISSATMDSLAGDPFFVKRQVIWFLISFAALLVVINIDYTQFYRVTHYLYGLNLLLLLAVFFLGREGGGAQRWIDLGFFNLQPSEFAKLFIIISLARHLAAREGNFASIFSVIPTFLHVSLPMGMIFLQPNLGTALVFIAIMFGMLFMAGAKARHLLLYVVGSLVVGLPLLWQVLKDYQRMRLISFINPERDALSGAFQQIQSVIAVGSGGVWGKGLFAEGTQSSLSFTPEPHTDFIFSVLAEQIGFAGSVVLILLYVFLLSRVIRIAAQAKDTFGTLICSGVASMLLFQVFINIGITIGVMPVTGLPLPFMSYGGSALLMNMMSIGLVLNVGMRRHRLMF